MTATHTMGPIRCRDEAAAETAAAAVTTALPDADTSVDGRRLLVTWDGDPDLAEVVAETVRPHAG